MRQREISSSPKSIRQSGAELNLNQDCCTPEPVLFAIMLAFSPYVNSVHFHNNSVNGMLRSHFTGKENSRQSAEVAAQSHTASELEAWVSTPGGLTGKRFCGSLGIDCGIGCFNCLVICQGTAKHSR